MYIDQGMKQRRYLRWKSGSGLQGGTILPLDIVLGFMQSHYSQELP